MNHRNTNNIVFLLGGHDLEMIEIRRILADSKIHYEDRNLTWNTARLSAYKDIWFSLPNLIYFGVELQEDCPLPQNYTRIDHHNDYNDRPAAIIQVANLLGVEPDRRLKLVAANDAGYIPAMQAMGATDAEITDIRRQDRAAQGVSEEDERLAEKSIAENLTDYGDLLTVRSLTFRFSPICDRLFPYRRLFIYTDAEWVFYGDGKKDLVTLLAEDVTKGRIYHGGGDAGYIGSVRDAYNKQQIIEFMHYILRHYGSL